MLFRSEADEEADEEARKRGAEKADDEADEKTSPVDTDKKHNRDGSKRHKGRIA